MGEKGFITFRVFPITVFARPKTCRQADTFSAQMAPLGLSFLCGYGAISQAGMDELKPSKSF